VTAKRDSRGDDGPDLRQDFTTTFSFDIFRTGDDQPSGIGHCGFNRFVAFEWQVSAQQGQWFRPGGGPDVKRLNGVTGVQLDEFFAYDPRFTGGLYVAGTP